MKLDIMKLAKKAGSLDKEIVIANEYIDLQRFANLIIEECAKGCLRGDNEYNNGIECAAVIREMKSE